MGIEVNKLSGRNGNNSRGSNRRQSNASDFELAPLASDDTQVYLEQGRGAKSSSAGELSGIYFGILNIYTTLPQFLGTFIASIVFAILEPGKSRELSSDSNPSKQTDPASGPNAIAVCLFIGAVSTLGAAYMTNKLRFS